MHMKSQKKDNDIDFSLYYKKMESQNHIEIGKALEGIMSSKVVQSEVEKRYLSFIQTRLDDDTATLYHLPDAALSDTESIKITSVVMPYCLAFNGLGATACKVVVDFIGAFMKNYVDCDSYCQTLIKCPDEVTLKKKASLYKSEIMEKILKDAQLYSEGWFGSLFNLLTQNRYAYYDFIEADFSLANTSHVFNEFFIFMSMFSKHTLRINIDTHYPPKFGAIYWLLETPPNIICHSENLVIPETPLSFERKINKSKKHNSKKNKRKQYIANMKQ